MITRKIDPDKFAAEWVAKNPEGCKMLAGAVLYSYFNDCAEDADERVLTLKKAPDAEDLNNELIDAIRCTGVIDEIEDILGDCSPHNW